MILPSGKNSRHISRIAFSFRNVRATFRFRVCETTRAIKEEGKLTDYDDFPIAKIRVANPRYILDVKRDTLDREANRTRRMYTTGKLGSENHPRSARSVLSG